ncbi:folate synthesis bifunctional protein-like protein [Rickettsia conorii str. Malish 7]|uniref:Folate synthesis bifunctional protein-like protein n=1 Tax=Rickettsia conorii (strain ATCC VR-613 / Malish 7) TaxID=272944 RepID=Q92JN2_RICCN|nr:folate synthesis bifunctional protein-like protein [Rickettsia conorii str. Malish 7]
MDLIEKISFLILELVLENPFIKIYILQYIKEFKNLGCEILLGHSRKSYISAFYNSKASERDLEIIAISKYLMENLVDYLQVHNVIEHQKFFVADHMINYIL